MVLTAGEQSLLNFQGREFRLIQKKKMVYNKQYGSVWLNNKIMQWSVRQIQKQICLIMVHSLTGMFWGGTSCLGSCVGLWTGWHCEEPSLLSGVSPKESTKHGQHRKRSSWKSQKPSVQMPTADAESPELHFWAIGNKDFRLCSAWTSQEKNHPGQEIAHMWCHK